MLVGYQNSESARIPKICTYPDNIKGLHLGMHCGGVRKLRLLVTGKLGVRSLRGGNCWQRWDMEYMGTHSVDGTGSSDFGSKLAKLSNLILLGYKECSLEWSTI